MNNCLYCNKICKNVFCSLEHYRLSVKVGLYDSSMKGKKHSIQTIEKYKSTRSGVNNPNYGKKHPNLHSIEFKKKQSINLKNNRKFHKTTKGISRNFTDIHMEKIKKHINSLNKIGFENKGGRCKFYDIDNIKLQGKYELYFYLYICV